MTETTSMTERHLSIDGFEEYLRHNVPLKHPIEGEPLLNIFIDPTRPAIGLRVPKKNSGGTPMTRLANVGVREVHADGMRQIEIFVTDRRLFLDAYPILLAIADRIQLDGRSLDVALSDTMRILGRLLERDELPTEKELGLFGELLLVAGLCRHVGASEALKAWRGPAREEHDFGLRGIDIEAKTTNAERRAHWINSPGQLRPVDGRPLWLVSYQLTRAGPDDGSTLPQLIQTVRAALKTGAQRDTFDACIEQAGWRESYETSSSARWRHRDKPAAYAVTDGFPRITTDLLARAGVDLTRVPELRYRVDLTDLPSRIQVPDFLAVALADGGLA
jgi:hypothetical protein